jgi:hypothetical protein
LKVPCGDGKRIVLAGYPYFLSRNYADYKVSIDGKIIWEYQSSVFVEQSSIL